MAQRKVMKLTGFFSPRHVITVQTDAQEYDGTLVCFKYGPVYIPIRGLSSVFPLIWWRWPWPYHPFYRWYSGPPGHFHVTPGGVSGSLGTGYVLGATRAYQTILRCSIFTAVLGGCLFLVTRQNQAEPIFSNVAFRCFWTWGRVDKYCSCKLYICHIRNPFYKQLHISS